MTPRQTSNLNMKMMMMMGRNWLFRVSICANLFVLIYLALYSTTTTSPTTTTPIDMNPASSLPNFPQNPGSQAEFSRFLPAAEVLEQQQQQSPLPARSSDNINVNALNNYDSNNNEVPSVGGSNPSNMNDIIGGSSKSQLDSNNYNNEKELVNGAVVIDDPVPPPPPLNGNNGILSDNNNIVGFSSSHESNNNLNEMVQMESVFQQPDRRISSSSTPSSFLGSFGSFFGSNSNRNPGGQRRKILECDDREPRRTHFGQRGPFWVFYNYFPATKYFLCDESITLTTHADFTFLDNLIPLLKRWQGPISLALYAPGTDFNETLTRILYLRECHEEISAQVKEFVTFHIFFDYKHIPKQRIVHDPTTIPFNCNTYTSDISFGAGGALNYSSENVTTNNAIIKFGDNLPTYKKAKKLPYPVNVARNVAREQVTTHHILASDIELYPNPNLIPDFLDMMIKKEESPELRRPNKNKLFVLSIFEVQANVTVPENKAELVHMLKNKSAIPFHKYVCPDCHRIPKANEWISAPIKSGLNVFHVGKRKNPFQHWEPIYIGTRLDPLYDERLTWEGRSDKMTQGYVLCVLDYEFHILDNAFLVHRPGIKTHKMVMIPAKNPVVAKQNTVIAKIILPELKLLYGTRPGCVL